MKFLTNFKLVILALAVILTGLAAPAVSRADCGVPICGNGIVDPGEQCDDGNLVSGDGCSPTCTETFNMQMGPVLFYYGGDENPTYVEVADLNNDGIQDWALTTARPSYLYTYLRDASGASHQAGRYALGGNGLYMGVGSLNGDHFADIVVADRDVNKVFVFFGNGDGTMTLVSQVSCSMPRAVEIGDVNTDGYDDIVIGAYSDRGYYILYGDGLGNFPQTQFISTGEAYVPNIVELNGDGYHDLLLSSQVGDPHGKVYLGGAAGLTLQQALPYDVLNILTMDLNRDGFPDLVTIGAAAVGDGPKGIRGYFNQTDATFVQQWSFDTTADGYYWVKTDLNNDGMKDVVYAGRTSYFSVYLNSGQGTLLPEIQVPIPDQANQFGPIDYNNDGTTDLIIGSFPLSESFVVYNHNYYQFPRCGDGRIGRGENCDDGNQVSGDGCSDVCRLEEALDSDHDGLSDHEEADLFTDPRSPDTDGDCVLDGDEYCAGADPTDPSDQPGCQVIASPPGDWHMLVTLLKAPPAYDIDVYLTSPRREPLIKHSLENVGKVSQTPVKDGDIVTFSIVVNDASEYSSDSIHGRVTMIDAYTYRVGFEHLPAELANWDYQDLTLLVEFVAKTPAVGVHTNSLDEFQATAQVDGGALTSLAFDGYAAVQVPDGAMTDGAGMVVVAGLPDKYRGLERAGVQLAGPIKKVMATDGQADVNGGADVTIAYDDLDSDGIVDGTSIAETDLVMVRFDEDASEWATVTSTVDPDFDTVSATSDQLGLFALAKVQPTKFPAPLNHEIACSASADPRSLPGPASWLILAPALLALTLRLTLRRR